MTSEEIISHHKKKRPGLLFKANKEKFHEKYLTFIDIEAVYDDLLIKIIKSNSIFESVQSLDYYIYKSFNRNLREAFLRNRKKRMPELTTKQRLGQFELAREIINKARCQS